MRSLEKGAPREYLDAQVASVAQAYGFSNTPVTLSKKTASAIPDDIPQDTGLIAHLASSVGPVTQTTQVWGTLKKAGGTSVVFVAASPKISIAQAFVVKASLSTVESAGFSSPRVLISSVGDAESRKRYLREVGNFFKKHAKEISEDLLALSVKNPDEAIAALIKKEDPIATSLPRTIDYLSESSRKIMLETIDLFEKLGMSYELDPRLPYTAGTNRELVFAIEGTDKKGNVVRVASGGRVEHPSAKKDTFDVVGMSISIPQALDINKRSLTTTTPACFVVHVGEAAKLKAFTLLDSLWRAHITLGQALLADTIQEQMQRATSSEAKYVAIIGQREALDNTVIVKNVSTQLQETLPLDKLIARIGRVRV